MNQKTSQKYRPVFNGTEVTVLAKVLKQAYIDNLGKQPYHPDTPNDPNRGYDGITQDYLLQLITKVSTLAHKVANNAIKPAYVSKEPTSLLADLGGDLGGAPPAVIQEARGTQSKEEYWEDCYKLYLADPTTCTIPQIEAAMEHKYLNDLMTPSEVELFETKMREELL